MTSMPAFRSSSPVNPVMSQEGEPLQRKAFLQP